MTGIILDAVLMLLLVAALGYGVRLERKLSALRAGQLAFAGAVTELNAAAGRAENALSSLRASGEEADMLHDRILKARAVKQELDALISKGRTLSFPPLHGVEAEGIAFDRGRSRSEPGGDMQSHSAVAIPTRIDAAHRSSPIEGRETILLARPAPAAPTPVLQALAANHAAQQSLNRARRSLDEDLFAA